MCGIVGLMGTDMREPELRSAVAAMASRIAHRGPDGGGIAAHADGAIAMKRLAIVDVEHGHQPMASDDGAIVLVHNGEIYNAPALRAALIERGVRFRTRSDTEVILRLYELDPHSVEEHLVGMWAFAIHDRRRRALVLSRDRFGVKPLFVAARGRALAFASELSAFDRSLPALAPCFELDRGAAHAMLSWGYVPEEATIFAGVERVPPAHRMTLDLATGERRAAAYWRLVPSAEAGRTRSLGEACALVESVLRRAVHEHLESDVPVASFLSGGIDSSLVTAFAAERAPIKAYTIGFREPRFDESPHARKTAEVLGVPLQVEVLDEERARAQLGEVISAYDEPFGDSSSLATYLLCQHVARDYKVALGGDGGDEVFAGYAKYRILRARRWLSRVPGARHLALTALSRIPSRTDRSSAWSNLLRVGSKLGRGLGPDDAEAYVALTQLGTLARTSALIGGPTDAARFEQLALGRFRSATGTPLQRTASADLGGPLPNDMLTKVDRASMACSLEARVPFLDHRVAEIGVGLPERFTLGKSGKRVLRALHQRRFGAALAQRGKWGFGVPVERWLATSLAPACEQLFERKRLERFGLLSPEELSDGRHRAWLKTDPILLWHAFALAAWCEQALGDGRGALAEMLSAAGQGGGVRPATPATPAAAASTPDPEQRTFP
jgi:asparagine synthase (glutamine-hydrolysing)